MKPWCWMLSITHGHIKIPVHTYHIRTCKACSNGFDTVTLSKQRQRCQETHWCQKVQQLKASRSFQSSKAKALWVMMGKSPRKRELWVTLWVTLCCFRMASESPNLEPGTIKERGLDHYIARPETNAINALIEFNWCLPIRKNKKLSSMHWNRPLGKTKTKNGASKKKRTIVQPAAFLPHQQPCGQKEDYERNNKQRT